MSLEKHFPTFTNSLDKKPKEEEIQKDGFIKSLGKKALPYIAVLNSLFATPSFAEANTNNNNEGEQKVEWKLTSPDGKQVKVFKTKEERDAFAKAHNLTIKDSPDSKSENDQDIKRESKKVVYRLMSPDGKAHKDFNSMAELEAFARSVNNKVTKENVKIIGGDNTENEKEEKEDMRNTERSREIRKNGGVYFMEDGMVYFRKDGAKVAEPVRADVRNIRKLIQEGVDADTGDTYDISGDMEAISKPVSLNIKKENKEESIEVTSFEDIERLATRKWQLFKIINNDGTERLVHGKIGRDGSLDTKAFKQVVVDVSKESKN